MKISDIAALPVEVGAALRHRRLFHPSGVLAHRNDRTGRPPNEGLPVPSGDVVGRVSKGVGLPGSWPDIVGLAWRMTVPESGTPWDVLLVSTVGDGIGRVLLRPVTSWSDVSFTSADAAAVRRRPWWVRARLTTVLDVAGLPLSAAEDRIAGDGAEVRHRAGGGHRRVPCRWPHSRCGPAPEGRRRLVRPDPQQRAGCAPVPRVAHRLPGGRLPAQPRGTRRRVGLVRRLRGILGRGDLGRHLPGGHAALLALVGRSPADRPWARRRVRRRRSPVRVTWLPLSRRAPATRRGARPIGQSRPYTDLTVSSRVTATNIDCAT